jgi:hypothetical protein
MEINPKQYLAKYFTNLISALTLLGVFFLGWYLWDTRQQEKAERKLLEERYGRLTDTKDDYVQVSANTAQLASLYKDQMELAKEVALAWRELAVERGERIKLNTNTIVTVDPKVERQTQSDYVFKSPNGSQGYELNELRIEGEDSPAIGYVLTKDDGEVYKKNYKFEIRVESVQLKDDLTGKIRVVSRAYLVPLENGLAETRRPDLKKWKDEKFPLRVTGGETVIDPQEPIIPEQTKKGWVPWTYNLNGGFGLFGSGKKLDSKAMVDTNFAGYGYSKQNLDWKFLHLGVNYSNMGGLGFHFLPFTYRPFPEVLTNTYVGPGAFWTPDLYGYLVGLNIGF